MSSTCKAQFNIKVGYSIAFLSPDVNNQIISDFNLAQSQNFDEFNNLSSLRVMHGVNIGLRQKFSFGSITLDWENISRSLTGSGINRLPLPALPVSVPFEVNYTFNSIMVGLETEYGRLGLGSAIGKNFVAISQETANGDNSSLLRLSDGPKDQFFARFHLAFNFSGSSTVAFSIRPYLQIPISKVALSAFATELGVSRTETDESYPMFGLTFAFFNGRQE